MMWINVVSDVSLKLLVVFHCDVIICCDVVMLLHAYSKPPSGIRQRRRLPRMPVCHPQGNAMANPHFHIFESRLDHFLSYDICSNSE